MFNEKSDTEITTKIKYICKLEQYIHLITISIT